MIGKTRKGRGFRGLLNYIHKKDGAACIGGNMEGRTPRELAHEFGLVRKLRPNLNVAVAHHSLSLPAGESLTNEQWNVIARRLLMALGYENSPYVVYLHRDTDHSHIHIVASRITYDGRVVSDSNDYYKSMAELRLIERDYGLRFVPSHGEGTKPASAEERHALASAAEPDLRSFFQARITAAADGAPHVAAFLERLRESGIGVLPNIASTGRVTGLTYLFEGRTFKGSDLGKSFSWRGVLERLGVPYLPDRDLPALLAARAAAREPERAGGVPPLSVTPGHEAPAPVAGERREREIRAQLEALGSERFSLQVLNPATGEVRFRSGWTIDRIVEEAGWLSRENARGAEILVRPEDDSRHLLLAEVSPAGLRAASEAGYEPAVTVGLAPGRFEVWLRHGEELAGPEARALGALLAERYGLDPDRAPADFGHLAGFAPHRSAADRMDREDSPPSPATVVSAPGLSYTRFDEAAASVRRELARRTLEAAVEAESRSLDLSSPRQQLGAALEHLSAAREAHEAARQAVEAAAPGDHRRVEAAVAATLAELRRAEERVERLIEVPTLPEHLSSRDLDRYLDLRSRAEGARLRAEAALDARQPSAAGARDAAQLAWVELRNELERFEHRHGFDDRALEAHLDRLLARPPEPLVAALAEARERLDAHRNAGPVQPPPDDLGAAFRSMVRAELTLESHATDLARFARHLAREHDLLATRLDDALGRSERRQDHEPNRELFDLAGRLHRVENSASEVTARLHEIERFVVAREISRLERSLEKAPRPEDVRAYRHLLARQHDLGERAAPTPASRPLAENAAAQARQAVRQATERLLAEPSPAAVARLKTALQAGIEIRSRSSDLALERQLARAGEALRRSSEPLQFVRPGSVTPAQSEAWRKALARYQELENRWAERLARSPAPRLGTPESLIALARRVAQGDRTPETLARLHRELVVQLGRERGSQNVPRHARPASLPEAVSRESSARTDLSLRLRRLLAPEPASRHDLHFLRVAVARYQSAASDLARFAAATRVVSPRAVIQSASLRGRLEKAVATWAAHAAARGASAREIAARLSRTGQRTTLAVPNTLRPQSASAVGRAAQLGFHHALHRTAFRLEQRVVRPIQHQVFGASGLRNYTRAVTIARSFRQIYQTATAASVTAAALVAARLTYSLARRFVLGRTHGR